MKGWPMLIAATVLADGPGRIESLYLTQETALTADPEATHWKEARPVIAEHGPTGNPTPGHRTEIRSRWTKDHLYVLFTCHYEELFLRPNGTTSEETNKLWEWDVAEVFVGGDFKNPRRYREYQVSPRGEYVDLDIDRDNPLPEGGWLWNSGFTVAARIDEAKKIWYGEMKIPMKSINGEGGDFVAQPDADLRINFYRLQGPKGPNGRAGIAWQPTGTASYHVPEAFGRMILTAR
jgi:hypothetical protein